MTKPKVVSRKSRIVVVSLKTIREKACPSGHSFCLSARCWTKKVNND